MQKSILRLRSGLMVSVLRLRSGLVLSLSKDEVEPSKIILYTVIIFFFIFGCQQKVEQKKVTEAIPVKVSRVELADIDETIDYIGDIKARDEALVYPKVSGKIIEKVKQDASPINKGEVIAYIDRDEVGLKFERAPVDSPLTGVVGRIYVDIGENVNPQKAVALVVDMERVKINLDIPEKYLPKISLGQKAKVAVDAYPEEEFVGQVTKISPVIDVATRSAPVEIEVDNPEHRLKSGMFAKVKLILQTHKNIPTILKEAVMGKEPNVYVYVIENKKASSRKVVLGIRQGPYYEVREGLKEGERVVIMGQQRLYEAAQVEPEE